MTKWFIAVLSLSLLTGVGGFAGDKATVINSWLDTSTEFAKGTVVTVRQNDDPLLSRMLNVVLEDQGLVVRPVAQSAGGAGADLEIVLESSWVQGGSMYIKSLIQFHLFVYDTEGGLLVGATTVVAPFQFVDRTDDKQNAKSSGAKFVLRDLVEMGINSIMYPSLWRDEP